MTAKEGGGVELESMDIEDPVTYNSPAWIPNCFQCKLNNGHITDTDWFMVHKTAGYSVNASCHNKMTLEMLVNSVSIKVKFLITTGTSFGGFGGLVGVVTTSNTSKTQTQTWYFNVVPIILFQIECHNAQCLKKILCYTVCIWSESKITKTKN